MARLEAGYEYFAFCSLCQQLNFAFSSTLTGISRSSAVPEGWFYYVQTDCLALLGAVSS